MRLNMDTYPISFWNVAHMGKVENSPKERVAAQHADIEEFLSKLVNKVEFDEKTRENINLIKRYTCKPEI